MPESSGWFTLTAEQVQEIAETRDPALRNHRITLGYHRLARGLAERIGPSAEGNWCAFATWASRQAGQTIRGEDLHHAVERMLGTSPSLLAALEATISAARVLGSSRTVDELKSELGRLIDLHGAMRRTAAAVARGNRLVFEEVGMAVSRYLTEPPWDSVDQDQEDGPRWPWLREGEPPDGQRYLRSALDRFRALESEGDPKRRAEFLLLANVEIGYHEQIRVDPEIRDAVNAPVPDADVLRDRIFSFLFPEGAFWIRARARFWSLVGRPAPLDRALDHLTEEMRRRLRRLVTTHLMALELPGGHALRLGEDLRGPFPEMLARLEHPELLALLARIDPTPDSLAGTGARDWADLPERVHYIVDLFRRHQETPGLLTPPYAPSDVDALLAGRAPGQSDSGEG
ncbi:MAG: hypothetical protein WD995_13095 [Gemmatimonadota bacterium]